MIRNALYKSYSLMVKPAIARLEEKSLDPDRHQLTKLQEIVDKNADSKFGIEHGFKSIKSWQDFKKSVPVRNYLEFSQYIESCLRGDESVLTCERPFMFVTTSGTTGEPKYIPITKSYLDEYRKGSIVSGYNLFKHYPGIANGTALSFVSSFQEGSTQGGIPYGAMTGALYQNESLLVKKYIAPIPYEVMTEGDYESRYYSVLRLGISLPTSIIYTPNPSTIDLFCRKLRGHAERLIKDIRDGTNSPPGQVPNSQVNAIGPFLNKDIERANELEQLLDSDRFVPQYIWPTLSVVSCWTKASASFYLEGFSKYFGNIPVCDLTYLASEGRGSLMITPEEQMLAIESHFFEFIEEDEIGSSSPETKLASQLEVGRNYYIIFTTSAGLYRYNLEDVIKVTGFHNNTPLIEFQYKGGNVSSFSGEKITELQVVEAMKKLQELVPSRYFCLVPVFSDSPNYCLYFEPQSGFDTERLQNLGTRFDQVLACANIEYRAKRESGRLGPVTTKFLANGTYEKLRKVLVAIGTPDAQIKLSHLNPKPEILSFLDKNIISERTSALAN